MQRMLIGLVTGVAIAFVLFVIMSYLIKSELDTREYEALPVIDVLLGEDDDEIRKRPRKLPKKEPPPKTPPPPQTTKKTQTSKPVFNKLDFKVEKFSIGNIGDIYVGEGGTGNLNDGEAIAMLVVQPRYPEEAEAKGLEGFVKFKFTVSADGSPKDIIILESNPRRVFDRSARRAIIKMRFKPKVVDGKAVDQPNMRYTIKFEFEKST